MSVQISQAKVIMVDGKPVGIQLDIEAMVRIYTKVTTPQRFGVKVVMELPNILMQEEVRKALALPEFDRVDIKATSHSPLEADLTLFHSGQVVGRYSVKASPTGNIDYIINSWRSERGNFDLLAIIPLEGKRGKEDIFFVAIIRISKFLKREPPRKIKEYIRRTIEEKRKGEGLDRLWLTDFTELSNIVRDLTLKKKQDEMLKLQQELLAKQGKLIQKQEEMLKLQQEMLTRQNEMLKLQQEISAKQDRLIQKQDEMHNTLKKILRVLENIEKKL